MLLTGMVSEVNYMLQVPGRIGDACVAGGAAYADNDVGGCGSTGDGDLHLRFQPCYQVSICFMMHSTRLWSCMHKQGAPGVTMLMYRSMHMQVVESMRQGAIPQQAAEDAIQRIVKHYPQYVGALIAVDKLGNHAGACHGWTFQYAFQNSSLEEPEVITVQPAKLLSKQADGSMAKQLPL